MKKCFQAFGFLQASTMIVYSCCLIASLAALSADASSIRGRNPKDDLVPVLSSRSDPSGKDNSLKIVSDEPFIIQLQVPEPSVDGTETSKRKKKRVSRKRNSKGKKHRVRRDADASDFDPRPLSNSTRNSVSREEIVKALTRFPPGGSKASDEDEGAESAAPETGGVSYRLHLPPTDRVPIVRMVYPTTPKPEKRPRKYTYKDLKVDRERLEQKIKYLKNMIGGSDNATAASGDGLRVRRKTEQEKPANKIAKMFLTLTANGLQEKKKHRCKKSEADGDVWEKESRASPMTRSSSTNEERYKVKKWIEYLKSKRSSRTCPCMKSALNDDADAFPLERKLGKSVFVESGEDSSESVRGTRKGHPRSRYSPDDRKRSKGKLAMPLDDLEIYRSRAKQILQNAEEILDKIKEEEEKRKSNPNLLLSHLRELTSRIQGDPRNNENDLIRLIQKNLGWSPLSKSEDDAHGNTFADNVKSLILEPYEKAKALTDESSKKLSTYLLKNLGSLQGSAEEPETLGDTSDETDQKNPLVYHGQEPKRDDEPLSSANLAKENHDEENARSPQKFTNWADKFFSLFKGDREEGSQTPEDEAKRAEAEEEQLKSRMGEMLKEQEKKLSEYTEAPNLEPASEEFEKLGLPATGDDRPTTEKKTEPLPGQKSSSEDVDEGKQILQTAQEPAGVAPEQEQVREPQPQGLKSGEKEDDVTASQHLEEKTLEGESHEDGNVKMMNVDDELDKEEDNVGADKVLDFEDLESLKAEIQSREEELEREEKARETKGKPLAPVLQSKHAEDDADEGAENDDVVEAKHTEAESEREDAAEEEKPDQLTGSDQKLIPGGEDVLEAEKDDSDESKSKEDTLMQKEGKLNSAEKDADKSEEDEGESSKTPPQVVDGSEGGIVKSQEPGEAIREPETESDDVIESVQGGLESPPDSGEKVELEKPNEESDADTVVKQPLEAGSPEGDAGEAPGKADDDEDSVKEAHVGEHLQEDEEEPLQAGNPEESEGESKYLEAAKPEETDESESTLKAANPGEEDEPVENDETSLVAAKAGKSSNEDENDGDSSLQAANPEDASGMERDDPDSGETPLRAGKPKEAADTEDSSKGDVVASPLDGEDTVADRQSAGEDGEVSLGAALKKEEEEEDTDDGTPLKAVHSGTSSQEQDLEDEATPLKEANPEQASDQGETNDDTPLRAENPEALAEGKEETTAGDDSESDETPLRAVKADEGSDEGGAGDDKVEASLNEPTGEQADGQQLEQVDDATLRAAKEQGEGEETVSEEAVDGETLQAAKPESENTEEGSEETPLRAAHEDQAEEMESENEDVPLGATADETPADDKADGEALLREANADGDLDNALEENPRDSDDAAVLKETRPEGDRKAQVILQEKLGQKDDDEMPLRAANLEKVVDEFQDQNDLEESPLRAADLDEPTLRQPEGREDGLEGKEAFLQKWEDDIESADSDDVSPRAENTAATSDEDEVKPLMAVHAGEASQRPADEEGFEEEESEETPLRAANSAMVTEDEDDAETSLRAEKPEELVNQDAEETNLRSKNSQGLWNNARDQENTNEESAEDMYMKAANPLEELNTPRYKQGEEDENLSEEVAIPAGEQMVEALGHKPKTPRTGPLKVPKSIGEIMKGLGGKEKGGIPSIQNLDPAKIDDMIDKIDEAEQENIINSEEVDCQKECKCAEKINAKSRNIGRYEIVKDFLHWVKDLQINRVLTDD